MADTGTRGLRPNNCHGVHRGVVQQHRRVSDTVLQWHRARDADRLSAVSARRMTPKPRRTPCIQRSRSSKQCPQDRMRVPAGQHHAAAAQGLRRLGEELFEAHAGAAPGLLHPRGPPLPDQAHAGGHRVRGRALPGPCALPPGTSQGDLGFRVGPLVWVGFSSRWWAWHTTWHWFRVQDVLQHIRALHMPALSHVGRVCSPQVWQMDTRHSFRDGTCGHSSSWWALSWAMELHKGLVRSSQ